MAGLGVVAAGQSAAGVITGAVPAGGGVICTTQLSKIA